MVGTVSRQQEGRGRRKGMFEHAKVNSGLRVENGVCERGELGRRSQTGWRSVNVKG